MAEHEDDIVDDVEDTDTDDATTTPTFQEPKPGPKPTVPVQTTTATAADDWKPPTKAEVDRMAKELRLAIKEARERKERIAQLEAANASEAEKAVMQAKQEGAAEREAALRPAVVRAAARAALGSAGCVDKAVQSTLLRLLDTAKVELDDDGEPATGLDEQIETLKQQFPEKFERPRPRTPSAREVDAGDKKPPAVKETTTQKLLRQARGEYRG